MIENRDNTFACRWLARRGDACAMRSGIAWMLTLASLGVGRAALEKCLDLIYPFGKLEEGSAGYTRMLKLREEVVRQFETGETAQTMEGKTGWTLLNSFTYPVFNPEKLSEKTDLANIQYDSTMWSKAAKVRYMLNAVESVVAA